MLYFLNILDYKPERVLNKALTHYAKRMQNYNLFFN